MNKLFILRLLSNSKYYENNFISRKYVKCNSNIINNSNNILCVCVCVCVYIPAMLFLINLLIISNYTG